MRLGNWLRMLSGRGQHEPSAEELAAKAAADADLKRRWKAVKAGTAPMDRALMTEIILDLHYTSTSPLLNDSWEEAEKKEEIYVARYRFHSRADWFDVLLDLLVYAPEREVKGFKEGWPLMLVDFYIKLAQGENAGVAQEKAIPLINDERHQSYVFWIIGELRLPEGFALLTPFVNDVASLPDQSVVELVDALENFPEPEAQTLVSQIRSSIPDRWTRLQLDYDPAVQKTKPA